MKKADRNALLGVLISVLVGLGVALEMPGRFARFVLMNTAAAGAKDPVLMAQAMRDPLFLATMAIANQDAPASGDLCLRCHTPTGWLGGRLIGNSDR